MPNGYSSQAGHVIFRGQPVEGTIATDIATAGVAMKLTGGSLAATRSLMIPTPEIGGTRDVPDAYLGAVIFQGQYSFYARINSFLSLLYGALGIESPAPTTTTGITTHTLIPSDGAALPFFSIEEEIGAGLETFNYTDAVVNKLHLEAVADGYLMGNTDIIAKRQVAGVTPTDPTALLDNGPLTVGTNITLTYNGVSVAAKNFKFDIANNFEVNDFRLGSFYAGSLVPKRRDVTGSMLIRNADSNFFRQAVNGSSTATQAGGLVTKNPLVITLSTYESIPGGTPTTSYNMVITIPKVAFNPASFAPSGDNIIETDYTFQALRPASTTKLLTVVTQTNLAVIA